MTTKSPLYVWYASFGSNLCRERFLCYIQGGTLEAIDRHFEGANDRTPPKASIGLTAPHRMFFARESSWWKGGVGFIDPQRDAAYGRGQAVLDTINVNQEESDELNTQCENVVASTQHDISVSFLRAYLITLEQYNDVVRQENKGKAMPLTEADLQRLIDEGPGSTIKVSSNWYGNLLHIGDIPYQGLAYPVLTFTCHPENVKKFLNPPSTSYKDMITRGLQECHWKEDEARCYIEERAATH